MKKILFIMALITAFALPAYAETLTCNPPSAGAQAPLFHYLTDADRDLATYTATLPAWFTQTGGEAAAP